MDLWEVARLFDKTQPEDFETLPEKPGIVKNAKWI